MNNLWRCHVCDHDCTDTQAEASNGCPTCGSQELLSHEDLEQMHQDQLELDELAKQAHLEELGH